MISRSANILTVATAVSELVGLSQTSWSGIFFQAPAANVNTVLFGDPSLQLHELRPGANGYLPVTRSDQLKFIAPALGDKVIFSFF